MDGWFWLVNSMHGLIFASYKGDFSVHGFNQGHLLEEENLIKHWARQVVGVRMRRDTRKTFCTINTKISLLDWAPPRRCQKQANGTSCAHLHSGNSDRSCAHLHSGNFGRSCAHLHSRNSGSYWAKEGSLYFHKSLGTSFDS